MNESTIVQLVVQTGAIGLCALMMLYVGKKLDRLIEAFSKLAVKLEILIDRRAGRFGDSERG